MEQEVKVKIIDMRYDRQNNLFNMEVKEVDNDKKKVVLAISGSDFGVTQEVSEDVVKKFCEDMKGKEKNLHIQISGSKISSNSNVSEVDRAYDDIKEYPIDEIVKSIEDKKGDEGSGG